jgi:hypothetical protein
MSEERRIQRSGTSHPRQQPISRPIRQRQNIVSGDTSPPITNSFGAPSDESDDKCDEDGDEDDILSKEQQLLEDTINLLDSLDSDK